MKFEHLKSADYTVSTWSGGVTRQLAIFPPDAAYADRDFLWRLSSATVDLPESDFTPLPDYNRQVIILEGDMKLQHQGEKEIALAPWALHAFDGAAPTHARGRCTDFNLMMRKGQCTGSLLMMMPKGSLRLLKTAEETIAIYCAKAGAGITLQGEQITLAQDETLMVMEGEGEIQVTGGPDTRLIFSRMRCE